MVINNKTQDGDTKPDGMYRPKVTTHDKNNKYNISIIKTLGTHSKEPDPSSCRSQSLGGSARTIETLFSVLYNKVNTQCSEYINRVYPAV